jgi:hypothetical protein
MTADKETGTNRVPRELADNLATIFVTADYQRSPKRDNIHYRKCDILT